MNPPIIEVTLADDGSLTYRLRPSLLDTRVYGQILATVARQIGAMMQIEGNLDRDAVTLQIAQAFNDELSRQSEQPTISLLQ